MKQNWKQMDKKELKALRAKKAALAIDKKIIHWFTIIDAKENTRRNYLLAIQYYSDYLRESPQQILDNAFAEIRAGKLMGERELPERLTGFREHLKTKHEMQPNTIRINMNGILSFYDAYDVDLPKSIKKLTKRVRPLEENEEVPKREDIQAALSGCDPLERAILLVGVASGLSMNEIRHLKLKDIKNVNPNTEITKLNLIRQKTDFKFTTFLTREATQAVQDYLNWRTRESKTARRSALAKQAILNDKGYVFIKRHVPDTWLKTHNEEERAIDHDAFLLIYRDIAEKCGKLGEKGKRNLIRSHNTRKVFYNILGDAGCDSAYVEHWMAHVLNPTTDAYKRFDQTKQEEIYTQYAPFLTIEKTNDVASSPEFKSKQEEIEKLKHENQLFVVERVELQDAKSEIDELRQRLENAENDYQALHADKEMENKARENDKEEMKRELLAEMRAMLGGSQEKIKEKLKTEPVKLNAEDEKEAEAAIKEML